MNAKIYNGNVQPNPKEFKIWVNDEGVIKTWNGTEWIEQSGGSGESGGGNGEASTIEYLDISDWETIIPGQRTRVNIIQFSNLSRIEMDGEKGVVCSAFALYSNIDYEDIDRIAIDFNAELLYPFGKSTPKEELNAIGITQEKLAAFPRLTKEQFYSLE